MPPERVETVIVNCSTKELAALALASALRHSRAPVTVIDCESTDGSAPFFAALRRRLPFTLLHWPLRRHGDTLDRVFHESRADALLLLDSDAEILSPDLVPAMTAALAGDGAYGSGFLHRGEWLGANHLGVERVGYYAPRMWIPCVLLRVGPVQHALAAGASFRARTAGNELPRLPWLAAILQLRFRVPLVRRLRLDALARWRGERFGERPHYVYFDTGAALHDHLLQRQRLRFARLPDELWPTAVRHAHGATRRRLRRWMRNAADPDIARNAARERIRTAYGIELPERDPAAGAGG
ncbi:MAG: hypothetical protein ABI886_11630 [Betaproteobacteria bacterium]